MNSRFGYLIPMKPSGDRLIPIEADRFNVGRSLKNSHNVYNGGNDEEGSTYSMFSYFPKILLTSLMFSYYLHILSGGCSSDEASKNSAGKVNAREEQ